jgi:hypothetical protein
MLRCVLVLAFLAVVSAGPQGNQKQLHSSSANVRWTAFDNEGKAWENAAEGECSWYQPGTSKTGISDGNYATIYMSPCPDVGTIDTTKGNVLFHAHGYHPKSNDLEFTLTNTCDGTSICILADLGRSSEDFNFIVDDSADLPLWANANTNGGSLGNDDNEKTFQPACNARDGKKEYLGADADFTKCHGNAKISPLNSLHGKQCCNEWKLRITDDTENNKEGTVVHWSLKMPGCSDVVIE